jgi:hypothetical protein
MKQYGNSYWQEATDNREKTVAIMADDTFQKIQQDLDNSGLNYCAYSDGKNAMVAINSSEVERFKTVSGLDDSLCRLRKSQKQYIPEDKNIIGNTNFTYIPQKTFLTEDRETVLKMAEIANRENIAFSARVYPNGKATMTVTKDDEERMRAIQSQVKEMRRPMIQQTRQRTQEIIGNLNYSKIQNKHFFISPLTPENYRKIEPLLAQREAEYSGLIRDNKVMFTVEENASRDFYAKLNAAICENTICDNLKEMGVSADQISVLNPCIKAAADKNMPHTVENYVNKDYSTLQLVEMNSLLYQYVFASENDILFDKDGVSTKLFDTKKESDTQLTIADIVSMHEFSEEQQKALETAFRNGVSQIILEQLDETFSPEQIDYYAQLATDYTSPNQVGRMYDFMVLDVSERQTIAENEKIPFADRFASEIPETANQLSANEQ